MKSDDKSPISRDSDKFMLRLPDGMRDRIAEAAKANKRSMNAEIVARLEESFDSISSSALKTKVASILTANFDAIFEHAIQEAVQNSLDARLVPAKKEKAP